MVNYILVTFAFLFLIFSVHLLFTNSNNRYLTRFLAIIILTRVGQIAILVAINEQQDDLFVTLYKFFTPFYYLVPACSFLYVKLFVNERRSLESKEWLHMLPFIVAIVHFLPSDFYYTVNWADVALQIKASKNIFITEKTGLFSPLFMSSFRISLMISYFSMAWIALVKSKLFRTKKWTSNKLWIVFILSAATFFQLVSLSALFIDYTFGKFPWFLIIHCVVLTFVILYILHKPNLLYGYLLINVNLEHKKEKRPDHSSPSKEISTQENLIKSSLEDAMKIHQPFLNPNFQILDLANLVGTPVHQCSQIINNTIGKNFRDWTNQYRIAHFIESYPVKKNMVTIESMANDSGFKSISTFYNAFKKETGLMPKQYFKEQTELLS